MSVRSIGIPPTEPASEVPTWSTLAGKPSTFPPSAHSHVISDVSGLQTALDAASASPAQATWSTLSGKPSTFTPSAHTHAISDVTGLQAALDAKKGLALVGNITVAETLLVSLAVGMKRKEFDLTGIATTDKLLLVPNGAPTPGCEAVNAYPGSAANKVSIGYYTPLLGIAASYSIPVTIYKVV